MDAAALMDSALGPLLSFAFVVALIPVALWLLKRTPLGGAATNGTPMRTVSVLALSGTQRIVTVEVGSGDERRWLVLGVTPQSITTLHTMAPQAEAPAAPGTATQPAFGDLLSRLRASRGDPR